MNNTVRENRLTSRVITTFAILTALVIIFQVFGSYIKVGATNFSFVLIPIVVGGYLLGVIGGTLLGLIFSIIVMVMGFVGADAFTNILLLNAPLQTIVLIIGKGTLAGFIPALIYKVLKEKNKRVATIVSAILAPIINTGLFIAFMLIFSLTGYVNQAGADVVKFLFITCAGINFLVEFGLNLLIAPSLSAVIDAIKGAK